MSVLRIVLVAVADLQGRHHVAIDRAASIASGCGARLELFHDLAAPLQAELALGSSRPLGAINRATRAHVLERLEQLAAPLRERGLAVSTATQWDYPPYEAIIRRALAIKADLIVVHKRGHHRLPTLLAYTDWELLRSSPVPVLLAKGARLRKGSPVIAAIDPARPLGATTDLALRIASTAAALATALGAPLHAVSVKTPWAAARGTPRATRAAIARATGISPTRVHMLAGEPDERLPAATRRLHAGVVALGSASHRGLKRLFIGRTAERVLDDLRCDVLVIKPANFAPQLPRARRSMQTLPALLQPPALF